MDFDFDNGDGKIWTNDGFGLFFGIQLYFSNVMCAYANNIY